MTGRAKNAPYVDANGFGALCIQDSGADPWVTRFDGCLYYTQTSQQSLCVWVAPTLPELHQVEPMEVWRPGPEDHRCGQNIWAPELHYLDGKWYLYFAADDGQNHNHRMYVLESEAGPLGPYYLKGKLFCTGDDYWAIDGTVWEFEGRRYFLWSGWPGSENGIQNLYIAEMKNPWTLTGSRTMISNPTYPWESWINEGPQILSHRGRHFVVFSANCSWTNEYKLGVLEMSGHDPLNIRSWIKHDEPIFESNLTAIPPVHAPGHCSFLISETEDLHWILYHVARRPDSGWDREVRAQQWVWPENGVPRIGIPLVVSRDAAEDDTDQVMRCGEK